MPARAAISSRPRSPMPAAESECRVLPAHMRGHQLQAALANTQKLQPMCARNFLRAVRLLAGILLLLGNS